jgi:hypothetical protein
MVDKHNPIISSEKTSNWHLFRPRPTPKPGVALVLFQEGKPLVTLLPGDQLTTGQIRWSDYKLVYEVNIAQRMFDFVSALPCRNGAFDFQAEVYVTYAVDNPAAVVMRNITDAQAALKPLILNTMRSVSRGYEVTESGTAEKAIVEAVQRQNYGIGLKLVHFMVRLGLEEDARVHFRKIEQFELDKQHQDMDAMLEENREKAELEQMKRKIDFYASLIKGGRWQLSALQLIKHPEDVQAALQTLDQERQADLERCMTVLKLLLEKDATDSPEIKDALERILQHLIDSFGTMRGGL